MALNTPTLLTPGVENLSGASISSASFTVGSGESVWAFVFSRNPEIQTISAVDDLGLTWTLQYASTEETSDGRLSVFSAVGDASSTGVLTIDKSGSGPAHLQIVGIANGSTTIVQEQVELYGSGADTIITLPAAATAGNVTVGMLATTQGFTLTSNDTNLDNTVLSGNSSLDSEYALAATSLSWTHVGTQNLGYIFEIEEYIPTPATLSTPTASTITDTSVSPSVTTNLVEGTVYCVAVPTLDTAPTEAQIIAGTDSADLAAPSSSIVVSSTTQTLPDITGLTASTAYDLYFTQYNGATAALASVEFSTAVPAPSVTTSATYKSGDTITFTPSDFAGVITGATLTDTSGNTLALTGVTGTTGVCPAFDTHGQARILYGTTTLAVTDGTDTATVDFELEPAVGYTVVTAASLVVASEGDWHYPPTGGWENPIADGDQAFTNDPFITMNTDGTVDFDPADIVAPYDFIYFTIDATDGVLTQVTDTYEVAITPTTNYVLLLLNQTGSF